MVAAVGAGLTILLKLLDLILTKYNADEKTREMVKELIRLNKDSGLISVQNSDKHEEHRQKVIDMIKKDNDDGPKAG